MSDFKTSSSTGERLISIEEISPIDLKQERFSSFLHDEKITSTSNDRISFISFD
jgi:hypothetical protein